MYKVAKVVKVVDVYHRRSPLVQGGLEPVGVCIEMELTGPRMKLWFKRNTRNLSMVKFEDVTATIIREVEDSGSEMELEKRS